MVNPKHVRPSCDFPQTEKCPGNPATVPAVFDAFFRTPFPPHTTVPITLGIKPCGSTKTEGLQSLNRQA